MIRSLVIALLAVALAPTNAAAQNTDEPMLLKWEDLLPEGEEELREQLFLEQRNLLLLQGLDGEDPPIPQIGTFNVVEDLDGAIIRMPGYILPLDLQAGNRINEFLLVPYYGACIHTPPPPPNQMVYVRTGGDGVLVEELWAPVWVEGTLNAEKKLSDVADAAYTLDLSEIEPYD